MSETCASCLDFDVSDIVKSDSSLKPKWLHEHDYVLEFISINAVSSPNRLPKNCNVTTTVNLGKAHAGKKVLYWAAEEQRIASPIVNDAKRAYNKFSNSGITTVKHNGNATFKLRCPQIYNTIASNKTNKQSYFRHMHFVVSDKDKTKWESQIFTKLIICKYGYEKSMKLLKNGFNIFINALPGQYYAKDHIPNSYNLFHKDIKKMSQNEVFNWFKDVIKLHYPKVHSLLMTKKVKINEVPIITYCAHDKCNASQLAVEELLKKGFVNVNEYSGGMRDYRNKSRGKQ